MSQRQIDVWPMHNPARVAQDGKMTPPARADALMDLLVPAWQFVIGVVVAVVVVVMAVRLARRGRSRMRTAMVVTGAGILGLTIIRILQAAAQRP